MPENSPKSSQQSVITWRKQIQRFIAVGAGGFVIDVTVFNILRATLLSPDRVATGAIIAKSISVFLAICFNWFGNKKWTFQHSSRKDVWREGFEFFLVSLIGSSISVLCLWVSHNLLQLDSVLADNISANVIGLLLGSITRFVLYKKWVFSDHRNTKLP